MEVDKQCVNICSESESSVMHILNSDKEKEVEMHGCDQDSTDTVLDDTFSSSLADHMNEVQLNAVQKNNHENDSKSEICNMHSKSNANDEPISEGSSTMNSVQINTTDTQLNGISTAVINHPLYKALFNDFEKFKEHYEILQLENTKLEKENARLEADKSPELYLLQIENLERTVLKQKTDLQNLSQLATKEREQASKWLQQTKRDFQARLEKLTHQCENACKERDSMVMKYAAGEKSLIGLQKEIQTHDSKLKEVNKEKESLQTKLKSITAEKLKISQTLDIKNSDYSNLQKEVEIMKEQLNGKDIKIKWMQNKLQTDLEAHKETQLKLDKLQVKLNEAREEADQVRRDSQTMLRSYQESQEMKKDKEQDEKVKLILEEEGHKALLSELETLKKKHQMIIDENYHLCKKVQTLEKERLEYEENLSRCKRSLDVQQQKVVDLQGQLAEFESTKLLLQHEQERLVSSQSEVERLRISITEMSQEMAACRERESELLDFTQKLTEKNVRLQSEFTAVEAKSQQLELEQGPIKRQLSELKAENQSLTEDLEKEKALHADENKLLARHLAEQTRKAEELSQQLEEQVGENQSIKKKHALTIKELKRELQISRRKIEVLENCSGNNSICQESRTSSNTSLNIVENVENKSSSSQASPANIPVAIATEPDRQILIDKIVKLQRSNARKSEKLDFLEEHVRQLVSELQKKTKIVQNFILREQSGALSSEAMDDNKVELSKHGGIMASVYNSKAVDEGMTLELSLEINKKLQAVLEDTLLKNITLKENMETLGNEIARLNQEMHSEKS